MSVQLTARVWATDDPNLKDARLLVLLALADFGNKEDMCWASVPSLAKRTRLCDRQVQRAIKWLDAQGYVEITEKGNGRSKLTTYKMTINGDNMSPINNEKGDISTPIDVGNGDNLSPVDEERVTLATQKGDIESIKGDIGDENYSHARREPIQQPTTETTTEGEDAANAAPPVGEAWNDFLVAFCWVCHGHKDLGALTEKQKGILTSEAKRIYGKGYTIDDLRAWFRDKWQKDWRWTKDKQHERPAPSDVRSMIPSIRDEEPVEPSNGYHANDVEFMPGVYPLAPATVAQAPPPLPPPMPTDDPWAIVMAELAPMLSSASAAWLKGSRLQDSGELAGVPFYQVFVYTDAGNIQWLKQQLEKQIRKKIGSILGKRVEVGFVAMQQETTP
jgi:hypothetical protein